MESKEELYERIEAYLANQMPDPERAEFKSQMEEDRELAKEVQLHADLVRGLNAPDVEQLRATIRKVISSQRDQAAFPFIRQYHRQLIAACIIIILAVIAIVQFTHKPTSQQLFAQYFEPYPDVLTSRDATGQEPKLLEAMSLYNRQEYDAASPLFKEVVQAGHATDLVYLYYGVNELARGDGVKALELLNSVDSRTILEFDFKWYRALAQIEIGNEEQAGTELNSISGIKSKNAEQVRDLLEQLNR